MTGKRVALLVDGDNIGATHARRLLAEAGKLGRLDVARVFGTATRLDWHAAPGFRMIHAGCGKNAADLLLCIDAMELALTHGHDTFVLASSDGDFSHIAHRLREGGRHVLGIGEAKAPETFRAACSMFLELKPPATEKPLEPNGKVDVSDLDLKIRSMIAKHSTGGTGMRITDLSARMHIEHQIEIKAVSGTWRAYLIARPRLYETGPKGPDAMVRFLPKGFES